MTLTNSPALLVQRNALRKLIGLPYGSAAGEFNCWTFTQKVQREVFGRMLPEIDIKNESIAYLVKLIRGNEAHKQWKGADYPAHGGLVEMSCSRHPHHVGTYLAFDGGGVIHCDVKSGSAFASLDALRLLGFRRFLFYDWKG